MTAISKLMFIATLMAGAAGAVVAGPGPEFWQHQHQEQDAQSAFLVQYEYVRAALAADDLASAKIAARKIWGNGAARAIAMSDSLASARAAFVSLSKSAIDAARGKSGLYAFHCPMFQAETGGADWVQRSDRISNPYLGKAMSACGQRLSIND